jgi:hypothetical protein
VNRVDENAARWRLAQQKSLEEDAMMIGMAQIQSENAELKAQLDETRQALQSERRSKRPRQLTIRSGHAWLNWLIFPVALYTFAKCFGTVFLGWRMR